MALIACPECRQQVSDKAAACPKCGYPIRPSAAAAPGGNPVADDELRRMIMGNPGRKIEAIKRCRDLYPGMGLKEAKEHVESLEGGVRRPSRAGGCLSVLVFMVCGVVLLWLVGCASAAHTSANQWRPIFDGQSLAGWAAPDLSFWRVEDGALTGETTREHQPPGLQFIVWEGEVRDFILRFQFRIFGEQANSGKQFRSQVRNGNEVHGYQADIDGQGKYLGGIWDEFGPRRSLAGRGERVIIDEQGRKTVERFAAAEELVREFRQGEWQDYEITAVGPKLTLRINGTVVSELEDREPGRAAAAGVLATAIIPGEPMKVQYRNLRLREL